MTSFVPGRLMILTLCTLLSIVVFRTYRSSGQAQEFHSSQRGISNRTVDAPLSSLFEGLTPNPELALKIKKLPRSKTLCNSEPSVIARVIYALKLESVVEAQVDCTGNEPCANCNVVVLSTFCYAPCESGSQSYTNFNPDCPYCGVKHNGQFNCTEQCGCALEPCLNEACI